MRGLEPVLGVMGVPRAAVVASGLYSSGSGGAKRYGPVKRPRRLAVVFGIIAAEQLDEMVATLRGRGVEVERNRLETFSGARII